MNTKNQYTLKQLQAFLGIANCGKKFIGHFANVANPLYEMLKGYPSTVKNKKVILNWNQEGINAFNNLRTVITSYPFLFLPDFDFPFKIETDASGYAVGGILMQTINNENRICGYFSKTMTEAQRKYATSEAELLAIVLTCEYFHVYLYGRKFEVYTDHKPLSWILTTKQQSARLARWQVRLQNYDCIFYYKKGK